MIIKFTINLKIQSDNILSQIVVHFILCLYKEKMKGDFLWTY